MNYNVQIVENYSNAIKNMLDWIRLFIKTGVIKKITNKIVDIKK